MMNLDLLCWSAGNGGPSSLLEIARSHSDVTLRDLIRPDGGTWHVVRYDRETGAVVEKGTLQGAGPETTWSRGQAWAVYGFVSMYRNTKDPRYLEAAVRLADYFIGRLPVDRIAAWDFQSDIDYRDVSASAIVTSGLFEMAGYIEDPTRREHYLAEARAMLRSLCSPPYFADESTGTNCLLDHSVQYLPINGNVDVPAIFADYFFLEAIVRYRKSRG
jgi:hypothetical protein